MNIAIVDDLKTDSDRLVGFIDTYMKQHNLQYGTLDRFSSGEDFLGAFTPGKYDLIFLDIYMASFLSQRNGDCKTDSADGP